jgi:hypothetical protein
MKRFGTACMLFLLAACSSVSTARIDMPADALLVEGANPRRWNQQLSFGSWRTISVREGAQRSLLVDLGVIELARADQAYRFALESPAGTTNVECHTREVVVGRAGVFVQPSMGREPVLVCGFERGESQSVFALTRSGRVEPSLRGELRQIGGPTFDVRSVHRVIGSPIASGDPFGFEILENDKVLAIVETINRGRVWMDIDVENRDDLAAAATALLLFRDPDAGDVD